jgi:hypothetical protein
MATVIVNHRVTNYTTWKAGFDSDEARRDSVGAKLLAVGEKADDPGNVYLVFDVADLENMVKMMNDPELKSRMTEFGVITAPEVVVLS